MEHDGKRDHSGKRLPAGILIQRCVQSGWRKNRRESGKDRVCRMPFLDVQMQGISQKVVRLDMTLDPERVFSVEVNSSKSYKVLQIARLFKSRNLANCPWFALAGCRKKLFFGETFCRKVSPKPGIERVIWCHKGIRVED
ncbi:MAG: hypothetical protein HZB22_02105 [Deltaproteobacteria bacterium]|nr:hypothetical protein [Deltaproteobacteria bacterium]